MQRNIASNVRPWLSFRQNLLELDLYATYAVRLVPMYLGPSKISIGKSNRGEPLALPSPTRSVDPPQTPELAYSAADRDRLDFFDLADNLQSAIPPDSMMLHPDDDHITLATLKFGKPG